MDTGMLLAISAGATFLLALAAFWAIWQNYTFRKEDRDLHFKLRTLDDITDWARKTRVTLVNSLSEYGRYQSDRINNLQAQQANLEAQEANLEARLRIQEAGLKSTGEVELLIGLDRELRSLKQELRNLKSMEPRQDDMKTMVISTLTEAASEYDFLLRTAEQFGELLQAEVKITGEALERIIDLTDSLSSKKYAEEKALKEYGKAVKECSALLGRLSSEAFSLKSLLLKYGSKLKL